MNSRSRGTNGSRVLIAIALVGALAISQAIGARGSRQTVEPDYTKGEKLEGDRNFWALGPIGAVGNIWGQGTGDPTVNTRMIQIREVLPDTPAAGVLEKGDVIGGVISPATSGPGASGGRFNGDARKLLSAAITEAEKKASGGKLVLNVWRKGETMPVKLTLPVKGTYSASAPWDCEKTSVIIDDAAQSILDKGLFRTSKSGSRVAQGGIGSFLDALGLLATGEDKYLPAVREYARALAKRSESLDIMAGEGIGTWHGGYQNLFLTEYYLITQDEEVLPGITALSTYLSLGQSGVGTWSHGMANVKQNGFYGPACAYGAMNSCSMTCAISLLLAQKCGIEKKEIDDAVQRSLTFFRWYVDKGCIPYGDHSPAHYHDNNGKNSQAAVLFDLAGNREAATYFAAMSLASYNQRERGHTGHFFSWQWGALGAARGGPAAAQSFIANTRWFTEMERRPDGGSVYQNQLDNQDHSKYKNWSTTGSRLLQHCLPRKKLFITGKGGSCVNPIAGKSLEAVVAAAQFKPEGRPVEELLKALGNWSLIVRQQAAVELGKRDQNVVAELIAMLDSPNRFARYGACVGLEHAGRKSEAAVDAMLHKIENDKDMTLRFFAVNSLKLPRRGKKENGLGSAVKRATPSLLKLAATYEPDRDPGRKLQKEIANLLFYGGRVQDHQGYFPRGQGSETLDRPMLIAAMKSWLINPNGAARSDASQVFDYLSEDELKQVWGDIYQATRYPAPSGVMFSGGVRYNGIKLMANHGIKEGIDVGIKIVARETGWGDFSRKGAGFPALMPFGQALEPHYTELEEVIASWAAMRNADRQKSAKKFAELLSTAKRTPAPELTSIESYIDAFEKARGRSADSKVGN